MTNAVAINGVTKTFGPKAAVNNLDLAVPQGSLYGFIGPNGEGKTTTIRMIMSIIFPDCGELSVLGRKSAVESKDRIGYLPEERGIYREMKAGPFLVYMARLKGVDSRGIETKVKAWLDRMGLADCYKKRCEELSKGMQQKVQFIAAIIHDPELIILDEPFSGLDPVNRRLLRSLIDEQNRLGRTIIFSTHAMFEAEQLCSHLFMIHQGNKVLDMSIEQVWKAYDPRIIFAEPLHTAHERGVVIGDGRLPADLAFTATLPGVKLAEASGGGVDLRLADGADVSRIMADVAARLACRHLELRRPNLEDIFIQLVGGDPRMLRAELGANGVRSSSEGVES